MYKVVLRKSNKQRRKIRVRKKVFGTSEKPRISIFRSNAHIYAQIIDDEKGHTLASASDLTGKFKKKKKSDVAFEVGKNLAGSLKKIGIKKAVVDRSCYKYHGRVRRLVEGVKEGGLAL